MHGMRNLDGCYFRIKRNGKWKNVCFTDMTQEERDRVLDGRSEEWLKSMINYLADRIQSIGNELDIVGEIR